ncbi:GTPase Era [Candidatus Sulfopaludibacter sp. SbA4]|nr:GTPase Era [Candidatus Sulfopaludibacter sp. SbA4]
MNEHFKSGFVSLIGLPNAGKSTLLNALVGQKVAIVADKPQTTRTSIQGVFTSPQAQIVFIDTPGIHKADSPLNKRLMDTVRAALEERDLLLYLVDAARTFGEQDRRALDLVRRTGTPVVLVLNKIDLVKEKARLLPLIDEYRRLYDFSDYVPVSAARGQGLDDLRKIIIDRLPEGPAYFPEDHVTDQPERFLAAELVREKVLRATRQEIPHSVSVMVDRWEETPEITRIYATIRVERDGQKGIVIGAKGAMLKQIGTLARQEMERIFGVKIYLDLHVRVQPGWREKAAFLNALDWRTMTGEDDF